MADNKDDLTRIMNRLRARLFNHLETMDNISQEQLSAHKKTVRDITSSAWNELDRTFINRGE